MGSQQCLELYFALLFFRSFPLLFLAFFRLLGFGIHDQDHAVAVQCQTHLNHLQQDESRKQKSEQENGG